MINAKRFAHMLVFCLTTTLGYSQDLESEYVARCTLSHEAKLQA
jgi:hypothetical protein